MKTNEHAQVSSDLPTNIGMPARRALAGAGYTQLEQLVEVSEASLKQLHGVGPKAIERLGHALAAKGLSFDTGKAKKG
jgi:hypothetical protein